MFDPVTTLGMAFHRAGDKSFGIRLSDRMMHLYVIGQTGTGKSTLLLNMARQDAAQGLGFCLIDPHGDLAETLAESIGEDAILWNVADPSSPYGYNPLTHVSRPLRLLVASGLIEALKKQWADAWGVRMEHLLRYSILALLELPQTNVQDIMRMFLEKDFRHEVIGQISDPQVLQFWTEELPAMNYKNAADGLAPIANKLGAFLAHPVVRKAICEPEEALRFRQIMDEGKILVVNLAKGQLGADMSNVLGGLIVASITNAAFTRHTIREDRRRPFMLYVDEFHSFTTEAIADMLNLQIGAESTFVPGFIESKAKTRGLRRNLFPHNKAELALATAWRLVEDGQSVLVYCPTKKSIGTVAKNIVKLSNDGLLESVLDVDVQNLSAALSVGTEWLGEDHPILKCLKLGVVIHHGSLPTPYRKEVEALLRDGKLKITVSSPTLAQGLNLTATAVVMYSLHRIGEVIPASEFKNVIGRAGRAFVDVEGLVLCPIFNNHDYRKAEWQILIDSVSQIDLESGLLKVTLELLVKLNTALDNPEMGQLIDYVLNNADAWSFPEREIENEEELLVKRREWDRDIAILDTAILSLIGDNELDIEEISTTLDQVLASSLWERSIARHELEIGQALKAGIVGRATRIWENSTAPQRKGYFLAGVGLQTGQKLDLAANQANQLIIEANAAILTNDVGRAVEKITDLAKIIFKISPFTPKELPLNWEEILSAWLRGNTMADIGGNDRNRVLTFIEEGLVYKLPWGIEALRVRAEANSDIVGDPNEDMTIQDFEVGLLAPALETGTLNRSAAILMQAGFSSRTASLKIITDTNATFANASELVTWLQSEEIMNLANNENWPTRETRNLWLEFRKNYSLANNKIWRKQIIDCPVVWNEGIQNPEEEQSFRIKPGEGDSLLVLSPSMELLGRLIGSFSDTSVGAIRGKSLGAGDELRLEYFGPSNFVRT